MTKEERAKRKRELEERLASGGYAGNSPTLQKLGFEYEKILAEERKERDQDQTDLASETVNLTRRNIRIGKWAAFAAALAFMWTLTTEVKLSQRGILFLRLGLVLLIAILIFGLL